MRYFTQSFDYDHSWSKVVIGMWHKYPNPHCTHVLSVDVVDRSVDPQTGVIRTERILGCKQRAPTWIVKLFGGSEDAFVREISFVDPSTQTATISSVNLSLAQFAVCNEFIRYAPAPPSLPSSSSSSLLSSTSLQRTRFEQTAGIESRVGLWHSVADRLESWLATRFEQNAQNGKLGFSDVLRTLWEDRAGKSPELQCHHS